MTFEVALVEKIYRKLGLTYMLKIGNLKRIYKDQNQIIVTRRRKIPHEEKREFSTECIICTTTWPCEKRICLEDEDRFILHNVEHILENQLEDIRLQPTTPRVNANIRPQSDNANSQMSRGTTPMKTPKGIGESKPVQEKSKISRKEGAQ